MFPDLLNERYSVFGNLCKKPDGDNPRSILGFASFASSDRTFRIYFTVSPPQTSSPQRPRPAPSNNSSISFSVKSERKKRRMLSSIESPQTSSRPSHAHGSRHLARSVRRHQRGLGKTPWQHRHPLSAGNQRESAVKWSEIENTSANQVAVEIACVLAASLPRALCPWPGTTV